MSEKVVTLKQAAQAAGRSVDTVRRWVNAGKVKRAKGPADSTRPNSTIYVRLGDVLNAARLGVPEGAAPVSEGLGMPTMQPTQNAYADNEAVNRLIGHLEASLEDMRRARDSLQADVAALRATVADRDRRIQALERELNKGVRGLLRRGLGL